MLRILFVLGILLFTFSIVEGQALQHKPKQLFISPEISTGNSWILNQNNYGYQKLGNKLSYGGRYAVMVGWDYFLKQTYKTGLSISNLGQNYSDQIDGKRVEKNVRNYYIQLPFSYKHVFGRKRGFDHEVFSPYVFGGIRLGYLFHSKVNFYRENSEGVLEEESLIQFVTEGGTNLNADEIIEQGNPLKDKELFIPFDINISAGAGYQYFITRLIGLFAEAHVAYGILDINDGNWRFRDDQNVYKSSNQLYWGINIGANFYLYRNKR